MILPLCLVLAGLAAVVVCCRLVPGARTGPAARKTALCVLGGSKEVLDAKASLLARLLRDRAALHGFATVPLKSDAAAIALLLDEQARSAGPALARAQALGARHILLVTLHDLDCRIPDETARVAEGLRVNTTLCVGYHLIEAATGRVLLRRTLALCRMTTPIISGTAVGSEVLDSLLGEMADRIADQMGSLALAA